MAHPTWLVTGASSGIGRSIALSALSAGYTVIGTTRKIESAQKNVPEFNEKGGTWLPLEMGDPDTENVVSRLASSRQIDVLVNCAGYALIGAVEDISDAEAIDQMNINFHGPLRMMRAVIPSMRARRSGTIVNISSGAGFVAPASRGLYSASKWALEGVSEALFYEMQPFGVRVMLIEPGAFRTQFSAAIITPKAHAASGGLSEPYHGTKAHEILKATMKTSTDPALARGDPDKAGQVVVDLVTGNGLAAGFKGLRVPIGSDSIKAFEGHLKFRTDDLEATREIGKSTDVASE